uniref:WPP domain-containing protein n=1 Tax=Leersia perrieri TaxID=77586 RepID=A0A0D9XIP8_9ORYZ
MAAADELPRFGAGSGSTSPSPPFSFTIWPPTRRTRDAVVRRLVAVLSAEGGGVDGGTTALRKRYGAVPAADAEHAARAVEAEAFDAASSRYSSSSVEDSIETLQLYSREVSSRLLDFVRSRSSSAAAAAAGEIA